MDNLCSFQIPEKKKKMIDERTWSSFRGEGITQRNLSSIPVSLGQGEPAPTRRAACTGCTREIVYPPLYDNNTPQDFRGTFIRFYNISWAFFFFLFSKFTVKRAVMMEPEKCIRIRLEQASSLLVHLHSRVVYPLFGLSGICEFIDF